MEHELHNAIKERNRLNKLIDKLEDQICWATRVSTIYKGVAMLVFPHGSGDTIDALGDDNTRGGRYYKNVNTGWYGVVSYTDSFGCKEEKTEFVPGWKSKKAAIEALKDWIITGIRPRCPNSVH
jgi:hypothetical protein